MVEGTPDYKQSLESASSFIGGFNNEALDVLEHWMSWKLPSPAGDENFFSISAA
jgi:hypothetical protein